MKKNAPKIAAQMFTVRNFLQNEKDFAESLEKVKKIGYTAVQLSGHSNISVDCLKSSIEKTGLTVCITHIGFDRFFNDFDNVIKEHKAVNCNVIGTGGMPSRYIGSKEGAFSFAEDVNKVSAMLKEHGMKFAYHNHSHEFVKYDGVSVMDILISKTVNDVEFIPDVYWVQNAGINLYEWLYNVNGRVSTIHYKDMASDLSSKNYITELGNGNIDFELLNDISEDIGVKYCAVEQDVCPGDPFESLKISYDYLAALGLK